MSCTGQGELEAVSVTNSSVQLQWQLKDEQLTVFNVTYRSDNRLDRGMTKTIQGTTGCPSIKLEE